MTPQLQRFRHQEDAGQFGDCHRTCIAMILDLPRDEVPHFMDGVPHGAPADSPESLAAEQAERTWLAQHGLCPVYVPYPGDLELQVLLDQLKACVRDAAVILGCRSTNGFNHSVVVYDGQIYNPNGSGIAGPMMDGFWWITIYSVTTKPLPNGRDPASVVTQEED